jgi:hypothetical protein
MNSYISKTSTFSAPVVQSRLEHHHQQQLKQPEPRQHQHQRSKSLNKGKRYNFHQKTKETTTFTSSSTSSSTITEVTRNNNKNNFSNFSNNFDSSYHRDNNNLVDNTQLQRKTSTTSRPTRRHQYSDSVDEDKFRVMPIISILKRPQSATDFVKTNYNSKSTFSLDVTQEEQGFNVNNNHRSNNNKVGEKSPPQQRRSQSKERRRSDVTPSKSKRAALRKEVKSMEFENDLMFNVKSSQPSTKQLSGSDESVVNSNKYMKPVSSNNAVIFPPLNYSNAILALEEGMNSNKKEDTSANSDDNVTVKSSLNKKRSDNYIESTPRRLSSTAFELQSQISRFTDSDSILFSDSNPARRPSSSPSRLGGGPKLYAGPTFHNSPAPSDLPMPSFYGKSLGKEPSPLSAGNNLFTVPENMQSPQNVHDTSSSPSSGNTSDDDIFAMDYLEPSKIPPYYPESPTLRKQKSQELLRILAAANTRQHQTAASYMVPERMATAHNPMQVHPVNLNEISETLRSLLKIHGQ